MSMTENEIIKMLETEKAYMDSHGGRSQSEALAYAIEAVGEIQQYRAMEEKLNGISVAQVVGGFINTIEKGTAEEYMRGRILTNREADMWDEYLSIGTIEEVKGLKEKVEKVEFILNEKKYPNSEECDYGNYDICDNALRIKDIEKIINGQDLIGISKLPSN